MNVPLREIRAPGARSPLRVTPKSMRVLLVLVDSADELVSRDTLLAEVWPDTLPSNDVVTQAVSQLRKAFAAGDDRSQYIETITKGGYRLLAEVEWLVPQRGRDAPPVPVPVRMEARSKVEPECPGTGPAQRVPRPQFGGWRGVVGAVAVAALLAGLLSW